MVKRIFIAINLPASVKSELVSFQQKWPELPARWTKPENLHITFEFIGNVSDEELENLKKKTREKFGKQKPYVVKFSRIVYGPSEKNPRMIWAIGESVHHITLARFNEWEFRRMDPEERPEINEEINIEIPVNSIEIMESKLKRGGAEYTTISNIKLNDR